MKKYIICVNTNIPRDYFSGKTYMFQGEPYAALTDIDNAKRYKSEKLAERAVERLRNKTVNCCLRPVIIEVDE